jgi:hypothetical protein
MATEKRTSEQGTVFDVSAVRGFLLMALGHDAVIDRVNDLLFEHVMEGKHHPSVVAASLEPIIDEVLGVATFADWDWVARALTAEAAEALGVEHPLDRTPEAQPPQKQHEGKRALRELDPGELREKLADIYTHDSIALRANVRAWWIIRRISQLTGISRKQIIAEAKADAESITATSEENTASTDQSGERRTQKTTTIRLPDVNKIREVDVDSPNLSVRPMTSEEVHSLELIVRGQQVVRIQAAILLGSNAGCTVTQIAATLAVDEAKVYQVIADVNERGLAEVRRAEREQIIEIARNLDSETFDLESYRARPGKYQSALDLPLIVALDIINGHGVADETTGQAGTRGYAWRVRHFVGIEDSQGFLDSEEWPTAQKAAERLRDFDLPTHDDNSDDEEASSSS